MRLDRGLQFSMATLVSLGTLVLGMGEGSFIIPILGVLAAFGSVYLTDMKGWLRLNNAMSNLAGAGTVVICLWELRRIGAESQALALANLLFYLQCVLMFRPKEPRVYWMIALLSLLQVAVAAALNDEMLFGFLLVAYFFIALVTMTLFLLRREAARAGQLPALGTVSPCGDSRGSAVFAPRDAATALVELEGSLGLRLVRPLLGIGFAAIAFTMFLFLAVPRVGQSNWNQPMESTRSTGFNERGVSLGELGDITEEGGEVLRVRYIDRATGLEFSPVEPPLLRGMLLTRYEQGEKGESKWLPDHVSERSLMENLAPAAASIMVEQEITIEPLDTDTLFAVYPFYKLQASDELYFDSNQERLFRARRALRGRLTYRLATPALHDGRQEEITRAANRVTLDLAQLTSAQQGSMPGLIALAAETVSPIPVPNVYARAKALESHLRDSGRYIYSLAPPPADPTLDPIEDFVTRRRAGHCEYFASALALMLRSQGIPARVVVGFRGGEINPLGHFYQVRQRHAHTWVEAYLRPAEVPATAPAATRANGGWLRLDPTPSTDEAETTAEAAQRMPTLREIWDYSKFLWSSYVVGLTAAKQQEQIFRPLAEVAMRAFGGVFDPSRWREFLSDVKAFLSGEGSERLARWFNWRAGLFTIVLLGLLTLFLKLILRPIARRVGWRRASIEQADRRRAVEVVFYRRLEALLARHHLVRAPHDTQREFAATVGGQLADRTPTHAAAALPRQVTEAFYRVRFGGRTLDNREVEGVEHALESLERAMAADERLVGNGSGGI